MSGRSSYFFADEDDLLVLLEAFNELNEYKSVQIKSELNQQNLIYFDPRELLKLAVVSEENPIRIHSFLVLQKCQEVFTEMIELRDGSGLRNISGQSLNPNSITFAFGGDAGDKTLIMSDVATIGHTDKSIEIHKQFKKIILAHTKKVGAKGKPYRLMPGAISKLKSGWRLASGKDWSTDTDAHIPEAEWVKLGV